MEEQEFSDKPVKRGRGRPKKIRVGDRVEMKRDSSRKGKVLSFREDGGAMVEWDGDPGNRWYERVDGLYRIEPKEKVPTYAYLKKDKRKHHGRPRKSALIRRSDTIHARVTPHELEMVREMAEECGMSMSEYVVTACYALCGRMSDRMKAKKEKADKVYEEKHPEEQEPGDELYEEAKKVCVEMGAVSTSKIQRVLGIDYNRAIKIVEEMERKRFCGPYKGTEMRKLIKKVV